MESNYSAIIEEMTNMIIRPYRDTYLTDKLGPTHLIIKTKTQSDLNPANSHKYIQVVRKDFAIQHKSQKIQISYFSQIETSENLHKGQQGRLKHNFSQSMKKCVIYLHANSGSRIQGLQLVKFVLPYGYNMAIFDYRGSGISDGQYTSMGVNEAQDLQKVMQHLITYQHVGEFSLWGRSMGAVTILYYLTKQYFSNCRNGVIINSIVLDSPFSNMRKLMYEIGANNVGLPQFVFLPLVNSITDKLVGKMGFNLIAELDLVARIKEIIQKYPQLSRLIAKINCLFLTSTQDKLVNHSHVENLHRQFPFITKELHFFSGQHNEVRPDSLKFKCAEFLCQKNRKSVNEHDKEKNVNAPYLKIGMRRSEVNLKNNNNSFLEVNTRQSQVFGKNIQKTDQYSPRSNKIPVNFRKEQNRTASKGQSNNSPNSFEQQMVEQGKSTIIINNNYNVNVNVYGKGPIQIVPDIIPPLNFKEQGGCMTDRLCDNHNFNFKFYMPFSAKVQRKSIDQQSFSSVSNVSNISNLSNISNSSKNDSSLHTSNYIDPQTLIQKQGRFNSSTIESHPIMFQPSSHQIKDWNRPKQTQSTILPSKQQSIEQNQMVIPLIKFDQVEVNNQKLYSISRKIQKNVHNQLKVFSNSPKGEDCFLTKKEQQNTQKQKLSLSQLRKIQKQVQQKSDIKSSKILYVNKQRPQMQQVLFNYKKQDIFLQPETYKYKSEEYDAEQQRSRQSKEMKCMKTSLMAKRKKYDRKSSDHISLNNMKHSLLKKEDPNTQQRIHAFNCQKEGAVSQKRLLYKFKIDRL